MHIHKNNFLLLICFTILFCFNDDIFAGKIITPWRARKEIVKASSSFVIWYNKKSGETIKDIKLVGPYNNVTLSEYVEKDGTWKYDEYTNATYNCSLVVKVPAETPIELYDLVISSSEGDTLSRSSVKVIDEYKDHYYIAQFTDAHVTVSEGDNGNATAPIMQGIANFLDVMNPEWCVSTGDNIIGFTRGREINRDFAIAERWDEFFEGDKNGIGDLHGSRVPLFVCTGNNDYDRNPPNYDSEKMWKLRDWNDHCGPRVYGFSYDNTRMLSFDDYLVEINDHGGTGVAKDFPNDQSKYLEKYLDENGNGDLRFVIQHVPSRVNASFCSRNDIAFALTGHIHKDDVAYVGTRPTINLTTDFVCFAEWWSGKYGTPGSGKTAMRILEINNNELVSYKSIRMMEYCDLMEGDKNALYLRTLFDNNNDGSDTANSASIINDIDYDFKECKVRFVMKKGSYSIDNGIIEQIIDNDSVSVYDILIDVEGNSRETINISKDPVNMSTKNSGIEKRLKLLIENHNLAVTFSLKNKDFVTINLYDLKGKLLKTLDSKEMKRGINRCTFNIKDIAVGTYIFQIEGTNFLLNSKLHVLK